MTQTIARVHPDIMTPEEGREYERILAGRFYLVRQGEMGELMRCKRCQSKHSYITFMCIERPLSGLSGGLYARWRTAPATWYRGELSPEERRRLEEFDKLFGPQTDMRTGHPQTARVLGTTERDGDIGKLALGVLEPITREKAEQLVTAINRRAGRDALTMATLDQL